MMVKDDKGNDVKLIDFASSGGYAGGAPGDYYSWLNIKDVTNSIGWSAPLDECEHLIFDLSGRSVTKPTQLGIYIVDRKKVMVE